MQKETGWVSTRDVSSLAKLCEDWNRGRLYEILWEYDSLSAAVLTERRAKGWFYYEDGQRAGFALGRRLRQSWIIEELWGPCEGSSDIDQPIHPDDVARTRPLRRLLDGISKQVLIRAAVDNPFANLQAKLSGAEWCGGFLLAKKRLGRRTDVSTPANCHLRRFRPGDEKHLSRIHTRALYYRHPAEEYRKWATASNCITTLAMLSGKPVGFFIAEKRPYRKYGDFNIAVDPSVQGRGIGSALLQNGLNDLADMGVTTAIADFLLLNAHAQALYRKHGFETARAYNYFRLKSSPASRSPSHTVAALSDLVIVVDEMGTRLSQSFG